MASACGPDTQEGVLRAQARQFGERPFLFFGEETLSFAELDRRADRLASWLQANGVAKGDRVGLIVGNRPDYLTIWFGVSRCGAILVPINPAQKGALLHHMLNLTRVSVLFVEHQHRAELVKIDGSLPELRLRVIVDGPPTTGEIEFEACFASRTRAQFVNITPADPATILFTSGTTGPSKGSLKTQFEGVETARFTARQMSYGFDDRILIVLPLFHGNAQFMGVMAALVAGAQVVLEPRFSAREFWDLVDRYGCTAANYVGAMLQILMKAEPLTSDRTHPLRRLYGSGAAGALEQFEQRFGVELIEGYGATEFGVAFLSTPLARRPGSCGKDTGLFDTRLVGGDGRDVAVGEPGELFLRPKLSNYFMLGYYGMPEETVRAWQDLWFHTGDTLRRDADGFHYFVDRKKDALRRRGENVSSFELEQAVLSDPSVAECAVVGIASDLGEDDILLCVVPSGAKFDPAALRERLAERVADFMVPRYVRRCDSLPRTPTQRIEKFRIRSEGIKAGDWDAEGSRS